MQVQPVSGTLLARPLAIQHLAAVARLAPLQHLAARNLAAVARTVAA
jgi:hypothetical protein